MFLGGSWNTTCSIVFVGSRLSDAPPPFLWRDQKRPWSFGWQRLPSKEKFPREWEGDGNPKRKNWKVFATPTSRTFISKYHFALLSPGTPATFQQPIQAGACALAMAQFAWIQRFVRPVESSINFSFRLETCFPIKIRIVQNIERKRFLFALSGSTPFCLRVCFLSTEAFERRTSWLKGNLERDIEGPKGRRNRSQQSTMEVRRRWRTTRMGWWDVDVT